MFPLKAVPRQVDGVRTGAGSFGPTLILKLNTKKRPSYLPESNPAFETLLSQDGEPNREFWEPICQGKSSVP